MFNKKQIISRFFYSQALPNIQINLIFLFYKYRPSNKKKHNEKKEEIDMDPSQKLSNRKTIHAEKRARGGSDLTKLNLMILLFF
jgi:hypothetical protein